MNYQSAKEKLGSRNSRKIANNTYLERDGNTLYIRLHRTRIVTLTPEYIEFNTGGWDTVTTKNRFGYVDGVTVASNGKMGWSIYLRGEGYDSGGHPYYNGIRINPECTALMEDQPNNPKKWYPTLTERSGW